MCTEDEEDVAVMDMAVLVFQRRLQKDFGALDLKNVLTSQSLMSCYGNLNDRNIERGTASVAVELTRLKES